MRFLKYSIYTFVLLFSIGVFILPLGNLFIRAFSFEEIGLLSPAVVGSLQISLIQAIASSMGATILGLSLALLIAEKTSSILQTKLIRILSVSYAIPSLVVVSFWISIFSLAKKWEISFSFSLAAVILAHLFLNWPWAASLLLDARRRIPQDQILAAQSLGASFFERLRWVIWPAIRTSFFSVWSQIFLVCVMSFPIVLILGGGPPIESLETGIYQALRYGLADPSKATAFAFWEILLCALPWVIILGLSKKTIFNFEEISSVSFKETKSKLISVFLFLFATALSFIYFIPLLSGFSFSIFTDPELRALVQIAFGQSLRIAFFSTAFVLIISLSWIFALKTSQKKPAFFFILICLAALPGAISPLVLSLALWLSLPFSSFLIVSFVISVGILPLALRTLWPAALQMREDLILTARTLGASPIKAFWYGDFFRWRSPILFVASLSFALAAGELGAVSFFLTDEDMPLSLLIRRLMAQYRFQEAEGVALFLTLFAVAAILTGILFEKNKSKKTI